MVNLHYLPSMYVYVLGCVNVWLPVMYITLVVLMCPESGVCWLIFGSPYGSCHIYSKWWGLAECYNSFHINAKQKIIKQSHTPKKYWNSLLLLWQRRCDKPTRVWYVPPVMYGYILSSRIPNSTTQSSYVPMWHDLSPQHRGIRVCGTNNFVLLFVCFCVCVFLLYLCIFVRQVPHCCNKHLDFDFFGIGDEIVWSC